jgi:glycosyltransferase involved in cell wall biosynthesis
LHPLKGHDVLLAAFQKVAEREKDVHLIIAGDGYQRARLRAVTLALNLTGRVTFLGEVGREKVKDLLAGCELLVLSSWAEGMPLAALEAMASGKAVIGTDVGALPEIVSDSEAGLLVPPGDPQSLADAILSLLWNPDRRKAMGGKGRDFVKARHDFSEIADRYLDVYQKALQNGMRRSRNASRAKGRPGKHEGGPQ